MSEDDLYAPLWDHIEELRRTLLRVFAIIAIGILLSFLFYQPLIDFFTYPLQNNKLLQEGESLHPYRFVNNEKTDQVFTLPEGAVLFSSSSNNTQDVSSAHVLAPGESLFYAKPISPRSLIVLGPLEGLLMILKLSFWVGSVATSPLWFYVLMRYIAPALRREERRLLLPFLAISLLFIALGVLFAYGVTIPLANAALFDFNGTIGMNMWSLSQYLDYTLFLLLANGIAFEFCAIGLFAVHLGMVNASQLIAWRKMAIVGTFIVGALLTPPDIMTQIMLAIPLIVLYEGLILYAKWKKTICDVRE